MKDNQEKSQSVVTPEGFFISEKNYKKILGVANLSFDSKQLNLCLLQENDDEFIENVKSFYHQCRN
jgi:hypothetical protein